jgi:hypothetical protein
LSGARKILQVTLILMLSAGVFGQTSQVPYAANSDGPGPTFSNSQVGRSFPGSYSSIRQVNFRNLRVPAFDTAGKPAGSISFKNGRYKNDESGTHYSEEVDSPPRYSLLRMAACNPGRRSAGILFFRQTSPRIHSTQARRRL